MDLQLTDVTHSGYLGKTKVVDQLVRGFVETLGRAESERDITAASADMADIFCGFTEAYKPIPEWNSQEGFGRSAAKWLLVPPGQAMSMTFRDFFMRLAYKLLDIASAEQDQGIKDNRAALALQVAINALLGTAETVWLYGPSQFGGWAAL